MDTMWFFPLVKVLSLPGQVDVFALWQLDLMKFTTFCLSSETSVLDAFFFLNSTTQSSKAILSSFGLVSLFFEGSCGVNHQLMVEAALTAPP